MVGDGPGGHNDRPGSCGAARDIPGVFVVPGVTADGRCMVRAPPGAVVRPQPLPCVEMSEARPEPGTPDPTEPASAIVAEVEAEVAVEPLAPLEADEALEPGAARPPTGPAAEGADAAGATRSHVRGSSLFLAGRSLSLVVNFAVQVLIARYLTTTEYGAFAYALSLVAFGEVAVTVGLDRAISRFLPIYEERGDWPRLFGTLIMVIGTVLSLGLCLVLLVEGLGEAFVGRVIDDDLTASLLLILILLAPIQALDTIMANLFAVFASPRAIFFRKYVLTPGLRLAVVALLVLGELGVTFLAVGYVLTGLVGVAAYVLVLGTVLRSRGVTAHFDRRAVRYPIRATLAYTIPLLTTDVVYLVMNTIDAVLVGYFHGLDAVATLRVVAPVAGLNVIVASSFALLFTPAAARLFAREDRPGIADLYWQTAAWMAVLSFPLFALTFAFSHPVTVGLYGERYAASAAVLSLLALGRYFDTALGFNGLTLRVYGDMRWLVGVNAAAVIVNILLALALVPAFGAVGAAAGTCLTLLAFNLAKQYALHRVAGIPPFDRRFVRVYGSFAVVVAALAIVQLTIAPSLPVAIVAAGAGSLLVLGLARRTLRVASTFPELLRFPFARRLLGD